MPRRWTPSARTSRACHPSLPTTCSNSATWKWIATTTSTFFPAPSPKFPRTSTSSLPSSKVSWVALTPTSTNSPSSRTTCRTKSPPRAWSPSEISIRAFPAPCAMPPTPLANSSSSLLKARILNSTTILFSMFPIRSFTLCATPLRTGSKIAAPASAPANPKRAWSASAPITAAITSSSKSKMTGAALTTMALAARSEDPRPRQRSGKSEKGLVSVRAYHRGNHIFIEVEDDGRGIDYDGARRRVVEMGAMSSVAAAELTERELREFLFRPGFTTASAMTELAGRGVGLDVVRANVHALNGEIEVRSEPGHGATFTVKVPLTLIISQALFVRCGTSVFALPLAVVEEIRRLKPGEIEDVGGKLLTRVRDVVTEVVRLDVQLALPPLEPFNGYFHMVIVKVAGKQVGVVVEEVLGKDEIVIKNLGDYLRGVKLFPGTTIAPDGSLILLIDLNRLASADTAE